MESSIELVSSMFYPDRGKAICKGRNQKPQTLRQIVGVGLIANS